MALTEGAFTIPEMMLVARTRVALGVGVGLLISDRLNEDQRKAAGWGRIGQRCSRHRRHRESVHRALAKRLGAACEGWQGIQARNLEEDGTL